MSRRVMAVARRSLALISLLLVTACSRQGDGAVPSRWRSPVITFYINREANALSETAIREVFEEWDRQTHFQFVYGGRNGAGMHRDGKSTISFLVHWPPDVPISKVGYCRSWCNGRGDIVEADIILNCQVARFTTLKTNKPDSYLLEGVLSHEIGHLIGLGHSDADDSLMKRMSPPAESYRGGLMDEGTRAEYRELYGLSDDIAGER
jgi:hypothetical protein